MATCPDNSKLPLEEFCEKELEEFGDIDQHTRQSATETIQRVCESPDTDSDSSFCNISSPSLSSTSSRTTGSSYRTEDLLTDSDWKEPVNSTLRFLNVDLQNTPPERQPTKFRAFLEKHRRQYAESSLSQMASRFRDFMMLTTAREYVFRKWRNMTGENLRRSSIQEAPVENDDPEIESGSDVVESIQD